MVTACPEIIAGKSLFTLLDIAWIMGRDVRGMVTIQKKVRAPASDPPRSAG